MNFSPSSSHQHKGPFRVGSAIQSTTNISQTLIRVQRHEQHKQAASLLLPCRFCRERCAAGRTLLWEAKHILRSVDAGSHPQVEPGRALQKSVVVIRYKSALDLAWHVSRGEHTSEHCCSAEAAGSLSADFSGCWPAS